jgi:protein-disulfide isomerase
MDQFSQCLITDKYASLVDDDLVTARNLRVNKAPAFVVNGVLAPVAGPNISELSKYLHIDSPAF